MEITKAPTAALVEELKKREGVEAHVIEPYTYFKPKVEGPATVFIITD